ncbi:hypothetical protein [Nocardiopsis tropica]|uniref:Uncharacterized protein n=1 Tax=Nocardiopsis tropica TaxID=109330 RepID=A0ABU7KLZ7_9ACTN|nr:hypothetical protein [Nocardiopsis umidischolae]MEE2050152.1 hypothetical protein [Nocardiopsis umidischolae]
MPTTFHRSRTLLAAGAIAVTAVLGLAACENTAGGEGDSVDSEEMTDDMSEEMTEESGEDDMSEDPMGDDMSEEPMDEGMDEEPMDDEG